MCKFFEIHPGDQPLLSLGMKGKMDILDELTMLGRSIASKRVYRPFLVIMFLASLLMALLIPRPFAQPIIYAIILASLFNSIHFRILMGGEVCKRWLIGKNEIYF